MAFMRIEGGHIDPVNLNQRMSFFFFEVDAARWTLKRKKPAMPKSPKNIHNVVIHN